MIKKRILSTYLVLSLILMSLSFDGNHHIIDDATATPDDGIDGYQELNEDWTVSSYENYSNEIIALYGDLTIQSGGHLVLNNTTLIMMSSQLQPYTIKVQNNGTLEMYGCYITDTPNDNDSEIASPWYYFAAQAGSELVIENSTVRQCGFLDMINIEHFGLSVGTNKGWISNTTINSSFTGLAFYGNNTGFRVENINISDIGMTAFYMVNAQGLVMDNTSFNNIEEKAVIQVWNSDEFSIENITLTGKNLIYITTSSGFTIKNIVGNWAKRLMNIENSNNFTLKDILTSETDEWNSALDISGCSNIYIDNITVLNNTDIVVLTDTLNVSISNISGSNISRIIKLDNSEYINVSTINVDNGYDSLWFENSNQISVDNVNLNNVTYPIRITTLTNSTLSNITLINPKDIAIDLRLNNENVTLTDIYLETDSNDFTSGLYINSSEVYVNNYFSYNINRSIDCFKSDIYCENIYINGSFKGERGIILNEIRNAKFSNVTVQDQNWDGIWLDKSDTGKIRMDNIFINNTDIGFRTGNSNITFSNLNVENSTWNISAQSNSMVIIINSTIGPMYIDNSDVICINATNTSSASLGGSASLTRKWWVDVFVNDTAGPIAGATVKINDSTPAFEVMATTGSDGFARNVPITEVVYTLGPTATSKNPHKTTAEGTGWFAANATTYNVTKNLRVNVSYFGNAPPRPPTKLQAVSDQDSNTNLTWEPSISQDVGNYSVYIAKSLADLNSYMSSGMPNATVSDSNYTHVSGSQDWQKYWYGVKANDSENESTEHAQASCGNWVVNNTSPQYIDNEDITLKGSLLVFGHLELNNTVLKMDSLPGNTFSVIVYNAGDFKGENVTIKRNNTEPYYFNIQPDAVVNLNDSLIQRPGIDQYYGQAFMKGMYSLTKNLTITNTELKIEYHGLGIYYTRNFKGKLYNVSFNTDPVQQAAYLLNIYDSSGVNVTNCYLGTKATYGIIAQLSSNINISGSDINIKHDNEPYWGIYFSGCSYSQIFNNTRINGEPAIYFVDSINISIESSTIFADDSFGIHGDSSRYTSIRNCNFAEEEGRPEISIYMSWCRSSTIENLEINDNHEILKMENESASIIKNVSIINGDTGITLINSNNIYITNSYITFIYSGMVITGCKDITLFNTSINLTFYCLEIRSPGPINLINCTLANGIGYEISAQGYGSEPGQVNLINSTILSPSDSSLVLNNSAVVSLLDTSFNLSKLTIEDSASRVEIFHYISIQVYDIDISIPTWANITIFNAKNRIVYKEQVNNGYAELISVHQKTIFKEEEYIDNPHNIYVYDGSHLGSLEVHINDTGHLDIFVSNELPSISLVDIYGYYDPLTGGDITTYEPTTEFDINLTYLYDDIEKDPEAGTLIHWYINGIHNSTFDGMKIISGDYTSKYETWEAIIYPSDGYDSTYPAYPYASNVLYIDNTAPEVNDVTISPTEPIGSDDLYVQYNHSDLDGDGLDSSKTTHKWYYYNTTTTNWVYSNRDSYYLPNSYTSKAQCWRCEVTPNDGDDEGLVIASLEVVIGNTPPTVSNAKIIPANPKSNESIQVSYDYIDVDSDPEFNSTIKWFKNGAEQLGFYGHRNVPAEMTKKGETWHYTIRPKDGTNFGDPLESERVIIGNTAPSVVNIQILPQNPTTVDDLTVEYEFIDDDGDSESFETNVQWLKKTEGVIDFAYTGLRVKTLSSIYTTKNEVWTCEVTTHDNYTYGNTVRAEVSVTIHNSAPMVSDLLIKPDQSTTKNDLTADYEYSDLDNDPETNSNIGWYCDNISKPELDGQLTVSHTYTQKGQVWHFTIQPNDGEGMGELVTSSSTIILNSSPSVSNITILPASPTGDDDLIAYYIYHDEDGDNESYPEIKWFENGIHQPDFNNQLTVESDYVDKNENWHFVIRVYDGIDYSDEISSNHPKIANSVVIAQSIIPSIEPLRTVILNEDEFQIFTVDAFDPDDDDIDYEWYLNGILVGWNFQYVFQTGYEGEYDNGSYNLTLEFGDDDTDRKDWIKIEWEVIVRNVNRQPTIDSWDPVSKKSKVVEKGSLKFSVSASDLDKDDVLTFIWHVDDVPDLKQQGSSYAYEGLDIGDHKVKVKVQDDKGGSAEYSWNVTVEEKGVYRELLWGLSYDFWGLMMAIISGLIAIMMFLFGFIKMRKKKGKLREYMKKVKEIKESRKSEKTKEEEIQVLKNQVWDEFSNGLITENHYIILEREMDNALGDVRKEIIGRKIVMSDKLKEDVDEVLKDGLVTKAEYTRVMGKISESDDLSEREKRRLNNLMKQWMNETEADLVEAEMADELEELEDEPGLEPEIEDENGQEP